MVAEGKLEEARDACAEQQVRRRLQRLTCVVKCEP